MKYLAIAQNNDANSNITFDANGFDDAIEIVKKSVKRGTMFQMIRLVELGSMMSKSIYFGDKIDR